MKLSLLFFLPLMLSTSLDDVDGAILLFLGENDLILNYYKNQYVNYLQQLDCMIYQDYDTIFKGFSIKFNNLSKIRDLIKNWNPNPMNLNQWNEDDSDEFEKFVDLLKRYKKNELRESGVTLDISPDGKVNTKNS